jgi:hypothetical protein
MTIGTPLVYYVSETVRLGVFEASVQDFLLLAALSALGGAVIALGMLRSRQSKVSARPLGPASGTERVTFAISEPSR